MKNANRSKSARPPKAPKTSAIGGKPEVVTEGGTSLVLPNPADAPPPKRPGRAKKPAATVATKTATAMPAAEVPAWAKQAATRDTAAEMAAVQEVAPPADATTETPLKAPATTKGRAVKARPAAIAHGTDTPGSLRAIGNAWIESIRTAGHSKSTVSSYANDLEVAYEVLDGNAAAADLSERQIAAFNESKAVLKKANGKPKAKPTILKTRRALRLALVWAAQTGLIKKAPFAAKTPG